MKKTAAILFAMATLLASPARSATYGTYDSDGHHYCALTFAGPDKPRISVEEGSGITGDVWLEFLDSSDRSFDPDAELRLEVTSDKEDGPDVFIGGVGADDPVPLFLLPLSVVGDLESYDSVSYQLEERPAVTLMGLKGDEVQRLIDCMDKE